MSLTRRQFLVPAGAASIAGPAILATSGRAAFAHFGAQSPEPESPEPESPERRLALLPKAKVNLVGSEHAVSARLWPPLAGETVRFEVSSGPNAGDRAELPTDDRGRVTFVYVGDGGGGLDVITASADNGSFSDLTATATKEWVELSAITAVTVTPATATNDVGETHELRARLTPAVGGAPVRFDVIAGPNAPLGAMVLSDDAGRASFPYVGDGGAGIDEIVAWVDVDGNGVRDASDPQATATKEWVEPSESPESAESPESSESSESPESPESPESSESSGSHRSSESPESGE